MRYTPDDIAFMQYVNRKINSATALTFELALDDIMDEIIDASDYFYEWLPESTIQTWLGIKYSDMQTNRDNTANCLMQLPEYIFSVNKVIQCSSSMTTRTNDLYEIPLLRQGMLGGVTSMNPNLGMSSVMISMFEVRSYNSLFKKGLAYNYSNTSCQLSVLGNPTSDIVLQVERKIDIKHLYNNRLFKKYVIAKCFENLANILSSFSFELIGGTNINFDVLQSRGERDMDKVEEELKDMNSNSMIHSY